MAPAGVIGQQRDDLFRILMEIAVPVPFHQFGGQIPDVIPPIAAFGKLHRFAQEFPVAQQNRFPQVVHLVSGIVDVILPENLIADGREDIGHDIADDGPARMADVERSRGVGADELHLDAPPLSQIR